MSKLLWKMHDFKKHPELKDTQMEFYYWDSPHKQITEDFMARVVKVSDGDTVRVKTDFRDFDFSVRLARIAAPELSEEGGLESARWLRNKVLGQEVQVLVNPFNRVGKWGRIIGDLILGGESMSEASLRDRQSQLFGFQKDGIIPKVDDLFWEFKK